MTAPETVKSKPISVLIVEDERLVAKDLQQTLLGMGYDAFAVASSADEAIARATEKRPDLVLMDIRIKGPRDGIETAAILRERFGSAVVYLTAHADDAIIARAMGSSPYGYLLKPVKSAQLRGAIEIGMFRHEKEDQLEVALRASRDLLEETQAIAHIGSWTSQIGPDAGLRWSSECYRIFGIPDGTPMTVDSFLSQVHHADREGVERASQDALQRAAPYDIEHRLERRDQTPCWVHEHGHVERDAAGQPTRMIGTTQDVTTRRVAVDALQVSDARYHSIVDSSEDAIVGVTLEGVITSWSGGAERLYQYSAAEAVGRSSSMLLSAASPGEVTYALERISRGEVAGPQETKHCRKDGSAVEVLVTVSPLRDSLGTITSLSIIARDLTAHRHIEAALARAEAQLRQVQKMEAIGRLVGGVTHDFNNLLSVILSYASLAGTDVPPGSQLFDDLQEIGKAGERAAELTRQLLGFCRQQVFQPRVVDLNQIVAGMKAMLARLLGEDILLTVLPTPELGQVLADPGQIEQILMNLVANARDAMPAGGRLTIETANIAFDAAYVASHPGAVPGQHVMLAIGDTGTGMDAATRARIFEPFFTTKEKGKGTGLGLATVFGIVQQGRGHLAVASGPGEGCVFKIYLPRTDQVAQLSPPTNAPVAVGGTETALLVEDDEQVRAVACAILRRHGYQVLDAANGGEALLISRGFPGKIHVLLTDVVMPRMSGRRLAEALAPHRPDMKVLFTSGYADDAVVHQGVQKDRETFLQKPFTSDGLLRKVREVLDTGAPRNMETLSISRHADSPWLASHVRNV